MHVESAIEPGRKLRWAKVLVGTAALLGCLAPQMVSAQTRPFPVFFNNNFTNGGPGPNGTFFDPETPANNYCTQAPNNPLVGWIGGQAPFPLNGLSPVLPLCASGDQITTCTAMWVQTLLATAIRWV